MKRPNATHAQLTIPTEQALAVVDLLDGLRELIWDRYGLQLFDELRKEYVSRRSDPFGDPDDRPF